jgi:hypothetical protein
LGAGIAAGLVLGAFWLFQPRATVQIYPEQGNSVIKRGQQQWLAKSGQGLKAGDWLRVSADGSALVKWRNEATEIELGSNTEWRLQGLGRSKALVLNQGMMRATVAPQAPVGAMTITTPHAEARVLGTCFTLDVAASATRLEVLTGTVELRKRQPASAAEPAGITVGPGQSAVAAPGVALVVQPFTGGLAREIRPWTANPLAPTPGLGILAVRDTLTNFIAGGWPNPFDRERTNTYRQRISGCLIPPATGVYYFWIASENSSELWLSTDQNPGHRRRIAFVPPAASTATASGPGINLRAPIPQAAWQKFPNQKSAPQRLKAGVRYYVEVAHQLRYGDAVMVGWAKSDASANVPQEIVPGTFLAPVPAPMAAAGNKTTP